MFQKSLFSVDGVNCCSVFLSVPSRPELNILWAFIPLTKWIQSLICGHQSTFKSQKLTSWCQWYFTRQTWWRHRMETFSTLLAILPVTGEFPAQRPVTRSFDVFFDLRLSKRLSKQSWGWWFETLSRPLWRHCSEIDCYKPCIFRYFSRIRNVFLITIHSMCHFD